MDPLGLDRLDLSYLEMLIEQFRGGPVGIETLAAAVGEQADTLQDVCEPYLMKLGFAANAARMAAARRLRTWVMMPWRPIRKTAQYLGCYVGR